MTRVFIDYLFKNPTYYVTVLVVVVGSIVLHELGHALAATWEGDSTPRARGHLTWNPVVHMGWLSIGLAAVIGIAWGVTPVTPALFRHRRWGDVIVAFAGPAVNLLLAVVAALVSVLMARTGAPDLAVQFWWVMLLFNVALFLLNMIPVPPLDGFTVADGSLRLGELGAMLRRAHPVPLIIVFLLISRGPFWDLAHTGAEGLIRMWAFVVPGAG